MSALTTDQLELLRRVRDGLAPWGGTVRLDRLQAETALLVVLRLIEPDGAHPYRLTAMGAHVFDDLVRTSPLSNVSTAPTQTSVRLATCGGRNLTRLLARIDDTRRKNGD